jgi:hypothetical protein
MDERYDTTDYLGGAVATATRRVGNRARRVVRLQVLCVAAEWLRGRQSTCLHITLASQSSIIATVSWVPKGDSLIRQRIAPKGKQIVHWTIAQAYRGGDCVSACPGAVSGPSACTNVVDQLSLDKCLGARCAARRIAARIEEPTDSLSALAISSAPGHISGYRAACVPRGRCCYNRRTTGSVRTRQLL